MARKAKDKPAAEGSAEVPLPSLEAVAIALGGYSVRALYQWREKYPDAPKGNVLSEWQAFRGKHKLGAMGNNRVSKSREDVLTEKAIAETRLTLIKIAKEERKVIPADEVDSFLLFLASRVKSALYQVFQTEMPPKTATREVAEVRALNREGCDAICLSMQTALEDWQKEQDAAREAAASINKPNEDENA
jgi:hypothetical protein